MSFIPLLMYLPGNRHRTDKKYIRPLAAAPQLSWQHEERELLRVRAEVVPRAATP